MGIFYSHCHSCGTTISWFLKTTDVVCRKCSVINTEGWIEFSFFYSYYSKCTPEEKLKLKTNLDRYLEKLY
jgi:hypothetical protein